MPDSRLLPEEEFYAVAFGLAISVYTGRMAYSRAEIILMKRRAGKYFERLDQAFEEAAKALERCLGCVDEVISTQRPAEQSSEAKETRHRHQQLSF